MNILAIESSCDETAVAVVRDGRSLLSDCIASQVDIHKVYGGVVPEIASRKHIETIYPLAEQALADGTEATDEEEELADDGALPAAGKAAKGKARREYLTDVQKTAYDLVLVQLKKIASGNRSSTQIRIPLTSFFMPSFASMRIIQFPDSFCNGIKMMPVRSTMIATGIMKTVSPFLPISVVY